MSQKSSPDSSISVESDPLPNTRNREEEIKVVPVLSLRKIRSKSVNHSGGFSSNGASPVHKLKVQVVEKETKPKASLPTNESSNWAISAIRSPPNEHANLNALESPNSLPVQSIFNETLISTGSPGKLDRSPVRDSKIAPTVAVNYINAISPLSDDSGTTKSTSLPTVENSPVVFPSIETPTPVSNPEELKNKGDIQPASSILLPLKHSRSVKHKPLFRENITTPLEEAIEGYSSEESINSYDHSVKSVCNLGEEVVKVRNRGRLAPSPERKPRSSNETRGRSGRPTPKTSNASKANPTIVNESKIIPKSSTPSNFNSKSNSNSVLQSVTSKLDSNLDSDSKSNTDPDPDSNSQSNSKKSSFKVAPFLAILFGCFFVLSLGGFIPAVVILAQGTRKTVQIFFKNEANRNEILPGLMELYGHDRNDMVYYNRSVNVSHPLTINTTMNQELLSILSEPHYDLFYGLAYSPAKAMEPQCGINERDTYLDLAKISTVTSRVRNYGMQCNQSDYILDAIQSLNLNMTLSMGVWIGKNETSNQEQLSLMRKIMQKYPESYFGSIFIGNEVLFRQEKTSKELSKIIVETKSFLTSIGYSKIPVGTSELGSLIDSELLQSCDIIGANIHPFFGGGKVESSSDWTLNFLRYQLEPLNFHGTSIAITEVGWPSNGGQFKQSRASLSNFKLFVEDFTCKAQALDNPWYFFEAFDEPWKKIFYEGSNKWETEWGVFHSNRTNKVNWSSLKACPLQK